jgi:hypothetical protein
MTALAFGIAVDAKLYVEMPKNDLSATEVHKSATAVATVAW